MIQRLFGIAAGCAIAILCLAVGKWLITGIIPFWLAWIVGVTGLVVAASNWRLLGREFAWSMAVAFLALIAPIPWPAPWLVRDAERIADGNAYCIQVAELADYRQARSWLDFSPIMMRPWYSGGHAMQFHAILAVGAGPNPKRYNWSYWSMSWRDATISRAPSVVSCVPKRSFAADLPYVFAAPSEEEGTVHLRFAGRSFRHTGILPADGACRRRTATWHHPERGRLHAGRNELRPRLRQSLGNLLFSARERHELDESLGHRRDPDHRRKHRTRRPHPDSH